MNQQLKEFQSNGFVRLEQAVNSHIVDQLIEAVEEARSTAGASARAAGVRNLLSKSEVVRKFAKSDTLKRIAETYLGRPAKPVKAILFDKTPNSNWYVTWHQDVTIAVKKKIDVEGFGPWSIKDDIPHVQPPATTLEQMLSIRLHLDDCDETNGAIKFIPGSHKVGIMDTSLLSEWRDSHDAIVCPARHGDIILMRPLILHSSTQSTNPDHRRVLHIEYTSTDLPAGLEWAEASGLDTVELVMGFEEEFGIVIPDRDAEKMVYAGDVYQYLQARLAVTPQTECLTQKVFYKLRRALIETYSLSRTAITLETKLGDLLSDEEIEEGWPFLALFVDLKVPDYKQSTVLFGYKLSERTLTLRELVYEFVKANNDRLIKEFGMDQDIWERIVKVTVQQLNVGRNEITMGTSFTRDLGVC